MSKSFNILYSLSVSKTYLLSVQGFCPCFLLFEKDCWECINETIYNIILKIKNTFFQSKRNRPKSVPFLIAYFIYEIIKSVNFTLKLSISVSGAENRGEKSTLIALTNFSFPVVQFSISVKIPSGILPFFKVCSLL